MLIIPAIDIINGKCVRLTQGDYARQKVYREDPLEVAIEFEQAGLTHLHLVDLDGARTGHVVNWSVIDSICAKTKLIVDVGGGIKTEAEIDRLVDLGVNQVNLGSISVKDPETVYRWIRSYGDRIILSADVRDQRIAISGWQEESSLTVFDFVAAYADEGIRYVTCTDISTDGTLGGPSVTLYQQLLSRFRQIKLTASGGVGSIEDLERLASIKIYAVIVGKAIYEGRISLEELKGFDDRRTMQ
jgi:phosphoribosylformimino-5-aminoimidazole carboxamide ribotide isomerase